MCADPFFFFSTAVRTILGQSGDSRVHAPIYRGSERDHPKFPARRVASCQSDDFRPLSFHVNFIPFFSLEHSRHWRSGKRDRFGRVRERAQGHERHRPAPSTRARPNHDEEGYGSARKARR